MFLRRATQHQQLVGQLAVRSTANNIVSQTQSRWFSSGISSDCKVSVIGGGQIGAACTRGLLRNGYKVQIHDPNEANREELESLGATWVTDLSKFANGDNQDVIVTALPSPPFVKAVMEDAGILEGMKENSWWLDHTTTNPKEAKRLHEKAQAKGVKSLEAPLTGGLELLQAGLMTVLVGGEKQILDGSYDFLKSYTETVLHQGDFGTASHVKIITNQLAGIHLIAAGEAVLQAKKGGVNLDSFFDAVRASAGNSYVFETEVPLMFNQTFEPGFAIELHIKDLLIGREIHDEKCEGSYDDAYPISALTEKMYLEAMEKYGGRVGSSFPAKMLEEQQKDSMACEGYDQWGYTIQKVKSGSIGVVHKNVGRDDL